MNMGRKLDILIAEKIMNEKVFETDECNGEDNYWLDETSTIELPHYSSNLLDAWKIVEKLKDQENTYGFEISQDQGELIEWYATFKNTIVGSYTPMAAICLAALKVIGVDHIENLEDKALIAMAEEAKDEPEKDFFEAMKE